MKLDSTEPMEINIADLSEEEIESLNTQVDEIHSALDSLEEQNDKIKERLLELLQMVRVSRNNLDQAEASVTSVPGSEVIRSEEEPNHRLSEEGEKIFLPIAENLTSLRGQLHELNLAVSNFGNEDVDAATHLNESDTGNN